ncbi:MAG: hypothetical protein NC548_55240, partial [Lachnospiraceae bacterium]|nr:hypothetical protein [Lachnospiraceae bacterium]
YEHEVVCRLIVHNQLAVTVIYYTACRVERTFHKRIALCVDFVLIVSKLQIIEPVDIQPYNHYYKSNDYIFSFFKFKIFGHFLFRKTGERNFHVCERPLVSASIPKMRRNDSNELAPIINSVRTTPVNVKYSSPMADRQYMGVSSNRYLKKVQNPKVDIEGATP